MLAAACGASGPKPAPGVVVPEGFVATVYTDGFVGPTQMVRGPGGDLFIAELNGRENDATGRVLRVDAEDPSERTVLQTDLNKPTGIAIAGDRLWIMEQRRLSVTTLEPEAPLDVVIDEMPFNGRSQGTLTLTPSGQLLFDTSGSKRGPDRVDGSGTIFAIGDAAAGFSEPTIIATGFKHAYTQLVDGDGQLWTVEMSDGNFDGERAPDELVAISTGDDGGWPQCVGDNRVVVELGGTEQLCSASPPSHALFGVGATPTSLVLAPWDADTFIASLWLPGTVVTVPRPAGDEPHEPVVFVEGIESPQHLLVDGDRLLVSDHATGQILAISKTE